MTQEQAVNHFGEEWAKELAPLIFSDYFKWIENALHQEYTSYNCTPGWNKVFKAFREVLPDDLKVVILGDRPYKHGWATGVAFAAPDDNVWVSRTLFDIIRHIEEGAFGSQLSLDFDYSLKRWTSQGVLCLNSALTTRIDRTDINNHAQIWQGFIKFFFNWLRKRRPDVVVLGIGQGFGITQELMDDMDVLYIKRNSLNNYKLNVFGRVNDILDGKFGRDNIILWDRTNKEVFELPF